MKLMRSRASRTQRWTLGRGARSSPPGPASRALTSPPRSVPAVSTMPSSGGAGRRPMTEPLDFLILGSGSTAFAAAIKANELGARVGMVERRTLGGTCANRGCLPSKNLIEAARIVWDAAHPRYDGLAPARIEVDFATLIGQKDEVVRDYRAKRYAAVADNIGVEVLNGDARMVGPHTLGLDGRTFEADRILIATGSRPSVPAIPG